MTPLAAVLSLALGSPLAEPSFAAFSFPPPRIEAFKAAAPAPVVTYAPITYRPVCVNGRCYFVPVTR